MSSAPDEGKLFVGREVLLEILNTEWEAFTANKHTYSGYFLYAIAGMGKTWALRTFYHKVLAAGSQALWLRILDREHPLPPLPHPSPNIADKDISVRRQLKLREGLAEVGEQLGIGYLWDQLLPELDAYDLEFELPHVVQRHQKVVVCLDGVDLLERYKLGEQSRSALAGGVRLWEDLQEHWLRPVLATQDCFILLTGQGMPTWQTWETARIIKPVRLEQLNRNEMMALLYEHLLESNVKVVSELSQGHAASVTFLVNEIKNSTSSPTDLVEPPHTLAYDYDTGAIEQVISNGPEFQTWLTLAPARLLDIGAVRELTGLQANAAKDFLKHANDHKIVERFTYRVRPTTHAWLLQQRREADVEALLEQFSKLADYYYSLVNKDVLKNSTLFIEWLHASLQYQFLQRGSVDGPTKDAWKKEFDALFEAVPVELIAAGIRNDTTVMALLAKLNYQEIIRRILSTVDRQEALKEYRAKLDEFIRGRIPGPLSLEDWKLLQGLVREERPIKLKDVQRLLAGMRAQGNVDAVTAREKIRDLAEIYTIKKGDEGYVVDEWLSVYLKQYEAIS